MKVMLIGNGDLVNINEGETVWALKTRNSLFRMDDAPQPVCLPTRNARALHVLFNSPSVSEYLRPF